MSISSKRSYLKKCSQSRLFVATALSLSLSLSACSDSSAEVANPFVTYQAAKLDSATIDSYKKREITNDSSKAVMDKVKQYKAEAAQSGGDFSYQSMNYDSAKKQVVINKLVLSGVAAANAMAGAAGGTKAPAEEFDNEKNIQLSWLDTAHKMPYFFKAKIHDIIIPKGSFLDSQDGKEYQEAIKKLGLDPKQLNNYSDITYEYNDKTGVVQLALNNDFEKIVDARFVLKIDGISKALVEALDSQNKQADPGMLLGMLSSVRLQELYIKMKSERTINDVFDSMPADKAKEARDEYTKSKEDASKNIEKMAGKAFSKEQLTAYYTAWTNFLEHKKPLMISIHPDIPQAFPTFFTAMMMAEKNPKVVGNLFKQLNLKVTN